ncbi:enoyl-CoA hydratase/isomerase family protein [Cupriavidus necator]|uniref:Enoyl-CoA hydratase/isomerase family protein n=1 Tax=Cupriavidus necator TaxID=106590 RepID=A0A367PP47_CUPNE|nr:enoyl-CoA hydratase/isomerase family protein [Cupriavidus necator]QQX87985.1 enoyl-CoA hydratase/isomerase family protein [Cupriavidus necator]RCJ09314.1 enoyl-CoA hydratase/isomerase family protein [Cupriavidus necator]
METIRFAVEDGVATLTLDSPARKNALSLPMRDEIGEVIRRVRADDSVRALILTAAGTDFSSGGDISSMQVEINAEQGRKRLQKVHGWLEDLIQLDVPVIAAVDGAAYGAGFSLALTADIILATPRARFGLPFLRMGLIPDCGVFYTLPRMIGLQRAKALMFSMRELNAQAAQDLGIVMEIVPADSLQERARALAQAFTEASPVAVGLTKQALNASLNQDLHTMLAMEADGQGIAFSTAYRREAADRFMAKQPLRYRWPD